MSCHLTSTSLLEVSQSATSQSSKVFTPHTVWFPVRRTDAAQVFAALNTQDQEV